jgi:hypothetical protein
MHSGMGNSHRGSAFDVATPLPQRLPLGASARPHGTGWELRIPVFAEAVGLEREVVVVEEVEVSMRTVQEIVQARENVRREELQVESSGDVDATRPMDADLLERAEQRRARRSRVLRRLRNR